MSPRRRAPSASSLRDPPKRRHATAFLTSSEPKMDGAMEPHTRSKMSSSRASSRNSSSSAAVKLCRDPPEASVESKPCLMPSTWR